MRWWMALGACLLLASTHAHGFEESRRLLPTAELARQIRTLPDRALPLQNAKDPRGVAIQFESIRREISRFIVRQIEAYPSISSCELERQLASAFGITESSCGESEMPDRPAVMADPWGPNSTRRVIVVAYCVGLGFHGEGGYETVLESYIQEAGRGVRRGASVRPAGFSGRLTKCEEVCRFRDPDRYWLLVHGMMSGASGRVLGGTAAVIEIGPEGGRRVWSAPPRIGNVSAHAHAPDLRWEVEYVDARRFYAGLPAATLLEVYRIDWVKQTYRRIMRQALD